ncbi:MAG: cobalamin B12-binding domain-containing protein [Pseudomonadota bacterium]
MDLHQPRSAEFFPGSPIAMGAGANSDFSSTLSAGARAALMASSREALSQLLELGDTQDSFANFVNQLVSPVARELGEAWVDDRLSFSDVTIGMARLQTAVQKFKMPVSSTNTAPPFVGRVFLASLIDTQHTLGASVAARAFSDAQWDVLQLEKPDLSDAAISYLRLTPVDLIAIGVGTTDRADDAKLAVKRLRASAPRAQIYLAGPAVSLAPDLFQECGADIVGGDVFEIAKWQHRSVAA